MKILIRFILSVLTIIISMLLVMAICLISSEKSGKQPYFLGYTWFVNTSTSMLPLIKEGDLVIVKRNDTYDISDIISYKSSDLIVTHRIVAKEGGGYKTKGDNNTFIDGEVVSIHNVYGKMVLNIHGIGKTMIYLMGNKEKVIMLLGALVIGAVFLKIGASYASKRNS